MLLAIERLYPKPMRMRAEATTDIPIPGGGVNDRIFSGGFDGP